MILSCNHINKAFGTDEILSEVSFHIEDQEKAAIVGINGAGKSTLLKIIVGELAADSGEVVLAKGKTLGYLAQHQDLDSSRTIYEELKEVKQPIIDLEQFIKDNDVQMAALTIPKTKAPELADRLVNAGIKGIWNFAHLDLNVPEDVVVENVHLSESLMRLSYRVCSMQDRKEEEEKKAQRES